MKKLFYVFSAILFFVLTPMYSYAGQEVKQGVEKTATKKGSNGKPCKGFDPKIDTVIEKDKNGNCALYHRYKDSPDVSFVYDKNGELWARNYGKNLQ